MNEIECTLDYETRSMVDLKTSGATKYARDESTSILCIAYKINSGPTKLWIPERGPMPEDLWNAFQYAVLIAHNAGFERMITKWCLSRYDTVTDKQKIFLFNIAISRWKCTAAKAAFASLPRALGNACGALDLSVKKDKEGHRLMLKYSKPRKPSKNNPKIWWDNKKELRRIYSYCITDVKAEYELDQSIPDLSESEQAIWELNELINERGILIDVPTVKLILAMVAEENKLVAKRVQSLSNGEIEKATQTAKVLEWLNERGAKLPNLKAPTIKDALETELSRDVRLMLEYRQTSSKTSTKKYHAMLKAVDKDARARELIMYYGATPTGRMAGKRIQPQNFPRPTIKNFNSDEAIKLIQTGGLKAIRQKYGATKVMDVLASSIRGMLIPTPGYEFFCADFAAVEARLAGWFAASITGTDTMLSDFNQDKKIYEEMAGFAFSLPPSVYLSKEFKDTLERFVGKESILGCQYGMGAVKFLVQCHNKGMKSVTKKIAEKAVKAYRSKYREIPETWKALERIIIAAVTNKNEVYELGNLKIYCKGRFLNIKLPSGRRLKYYEPSIRQKRNRWGGLSSEIRYYAWDWGINPETGKKKKMWKEITSWGGIFFNHVVQGTARDLMMCGIKNIEDAKYKFLLSVHDEGLSERKIGKGSVEEYIELMCGNLPAWAKGAPIKAEGWKGMRYRK